MTWLLGISLASFSASGFADDPIYTGIFSDTALGGYDAVSYFRGNGEPVKGSSEFELDWQGATWRFSSQAHLDAFTASPEKYAPQYGGYCAWAAGNGKLAKGDPLIYSKIGDKLYLNYNKKIHQKWLPNSKDFIEKGDALFPGLVDPI